MKQIFTFLFFVAFAATFGQGAVYINNLKEFNEKQELAKAHGIKSIRVVKTKFKNAKRGRLVYLEEYDHQGKILSRLNRYGLWNKRMQTFDHNTNGQITVIFDDTYSRNYHEITFAAYYPDGNLKYAMNDFVKTGRIPYDFDTLFLFYQDGSLLDFTFGSKQQDTLFYHYGLSGRIWHRSREKHDTINDSDLSLDVNGCYIGNKGENAQEGDFRYTYQKDSDCQTTRYIIKAYYQERWVVIYDQQSIYNSGKLIEVKYFDCKKGLTSKCTGEVGFSGHARSSYLENGMKDQVTQLSRLGKVKYYVKYIYEYY